MVLSLLLHSSSRPQAGWVARPHRLWTEHKKLKICVYVFLCSPDTELACAEPGPAENPCSLMAETVQKLGSGRSHDCLPGRAPSSVMSSLSRAALGSGGAHKKGVCVCVCVCVHVCVQPVAGRCSPPGEGTAESHLGRLARGDGRGWLVGFPVPVPGRALSLRSRFAYRVSATWLSQERCCTSSAVPEVGASDGNGCARAAPSWLCRRKAPSTPRSSG